MTDDLIAHLRKSGNIWQIAAADALEAQARRIAELEGENKYLTELNADVYVLGVERGEAKFSARIAELEAAIDEAIEYVAGHDDEWPKALSARLRAARAAYLGEKE